MKKASGGQAGLRQGKDESRGCCSPHSHSQGLDVTLGVFLATLSGSGLWRLPRCLPASRTAVPSPALCPLGGPTSGQSGF